MQTNTEVHTMVATLQGALQYISDTFVNASQLAETVKQVQDELGSVRSSLEGRIQQMQNELDHLRNINAGLEESIAHVRSERDAHQAEVGQLRSENAQLQNERNELEERVRNLNLQIEEANAQIEQVKRNHDDAELRAMHWEEEHNRIKEAHDKVLTALGVAPQPRNEFGQFQSPKLVEDQHEARTGTDNIWR